MKYLTLFLIFICYISYGQSYIDLEKLQKEADIQTTKTINSFNNLNIVTDADIQRLNQKAPEYKPVYYPVYPTQEVKLNIIPNKPVNNTTTINNTTNVININNTINNTNNSYYCCNTNNSLIVKPAVAPRLILVPF